MWDCSPSSYYVDSDSSITKCLSPQPSPLSLPPGCMFSSFYLFPSYCYLSSFLFSTIATALRQFPELPLVSLLSVHAPPSSHWIHLQCNSDSFLQSACLSSMWPQPLSELSEAGIQHRAFILLPTGPSSPQLVYQISDRDSSERPLPLLPPHCKSPPTTISLQ